MFKGKKNDARKLAAVSVTMLTMMFTAVQPSMPLLADIGAPAGLVIEAEASTSYFPKCSKSATSIVDALKAAGYDSSYSYREKIAKANGINDYKGSASQNTDLLNRMKRGELKKPGSGSESGSSSTVAKSKNLSEALYGTSKAYISCGFDGYKNTSGRHEGIDFRYKFDAPIYALADGEVLRVANGHTGSNGLSTIAIYNKAADKTVIYLHSNPSVKAGDKVKVGDKIGYESWRGISSKSSSHTHVEVRNGKKEYAAKSVGDNTLDNSSPSSFWKSLGYKVK